MSYFDPPVMCLSKGGFYDFVCEHHAHSTGLRSVCLYNKQWKRITFQYKCPNKEWQKNKTEIKQQQENQ